MNERKKLLVICRKAPYGNSLSRAGLDVILAAAAFDQDLSVLFMDDGVWQLVPDQQGGLVGRKTVSATLESLPLYDVDTFHVDAVSLQRRQLQASELQGKLVTLEGPALAEFIDGHDQVIGF